MVVLKFIRPIKFDLNLIFNDHKRVLKSFLCLGSVLGRIRVEKFGRVTLLP